MTADAIDDAWMETCHVTITAIGKQDVEFGSLTETVDVDLGEKDIEGKPTTKGGRVTQFTPEGDSSVTLEVYPLEAGAGDGFFDLLNGDRELLIGTTTGTTASKLVDTSENFVTRGVAAGDIIDNITDSTFAVVTAVDDANTLSLSADVMTSGEDYKITRSNVVVAGTTTGTTTSKLVDASENFTNRGVAAGDKVRNTTDDTETTVSAVDNATTLSVASDIMASGENYTITQSPQRMLNNRIRTKMRILMLWTNDASVVNAASTTAQNKSALRIGLADGKITGVKPSFTDGILKFTITYKCAPFDKSGNSNVMMESAAGSTALDILPTIAAYTTSNKFG